MPKELPKSPSISPSAELRADINTLMERGVTIWGPNRGWPAGASPRINQIYARFIQMRDALAIELSDTEKSILLECLSGSVVNDSFVEGLELEVMDSEGVEAFPDEGNALIEKIKGASMAERLATLDVLGY
ncbi:MAG: hypothetical protein DSY85_03080 [Marinomonas sp.]|nr:MAG: hypothetical protein DSY85_03080 [Marinomonas sp.]